MLNRSLTNVACIFLNVTWIVGCRCAPQSIFTPDAPRPLGPYSQAIVCDGMVYGAGQLGIDPATGKLVSPEADAQMDQALKNVFAVLKAAGSSREKILKVTVYFKDLNDFGRVNAVYERYLPDHRPARSAVQVPRIPDDALIEIDYIAAR